MLRLAEIKQRLMTLIFDCWLSSWSRSSLMCMYCPHKSKLAHLQQTCSVGQISRRKALGFAWETNDWGQVRQHRVETNFCLEARNIPESRYASWNSSQILQSCRCQHCHYGCEAWALTAKHSRRVFTTSVFGRYSRSKKCRQFKSWRCGRELADWWRHGHS